MFNNIDTSGLYYKHITIINDNFSIISKIEDSLTDDARVIIYILHMFIVEATGVNVINPFPSSLMLTENQLECIPLANLSSLVLCLRLRQGTLL
jgi:hypothetical protein